ncbi:terminase small subunit [Iocasia frigidifontis]|uniref:terminase small subunit n=1 Tax=Iocasia fonsfrigidae TaxID=2682810 RepID=UPI001E5C48F0|nr:terminase small subunit [Iocasia fonsfrigidae]
MPRSRSPNSIKAEKIYLESNGKAILKDIAEKIGVAPGTVRSWKYRYKWDDKLNNDDNATLQKKENKRNVAKKKKDKTPKHVKIAEESNIQDANLTEKQRLFCLYYVKIFNATMAAIKAGYSPDTAGQIGYQLLQKTSIKKEIRRLKSNMAGELFLDAMDVLRKYVEIAFADITDFVEFGQRKTQVIGQYGPVYEGKGDNKKPVMQTLNYVDLKPSEKIDGTIISQVKQGRDGVSIKLEDKKWALEKLEKYFDLIPDKWKRKIEEEKLAIAKLKADKHDKKDIKVTIIDDIEDDIDED